MTGKTYAKPSVKRVETLTAVTALIFKPISGKVKRR